MGRLAWRALLAFLIGFTLMFALQHRRAYARDDGRYAGSNLKQWFDGLHSGKGLCCSVADGRTLEDPDVDTQGGRYRVKVDGTWYDVPDAALISEPNKLGQPIVWPYVDTDGKVQIRCFMPATGS